MRIIIRTEHNKRDFDKNFLQLPALLYKEEEYVQDVKTEKRILADKHLLCKDVTNAFYIAVEGDAVLARCCLTYYKDCKTASLGFFESYDNYEITDELFSKVFEKCRADGIESIQGPVDMSFWIKYRFKQFHDGDEKRPYTCEPYNKDYYIELWKRAGFAVTDQYFSNRLKAFTPEDHDSKCELRYRQMHERGYTWVNLDKKKFSRSIKDLYRLFTELYSSFPGYRPISEGDFIKQFSGLKYILDEDMVKLVYDKEQLIAFFICIPNYYNLTNNITLENIIRILKLKRNPSEYVLLYMGVDKTALGLGAALAQAIKIELEKKGRKSIGALIHAGKVTGTYYDNCITHRNEYVLMKFNLFPCTCSIP